MFCAMCPTPLLTVVENTQQWKNISTPAWLRSVGDYHFRSFPGLPPFTKRSTARLHAWGRGGWTRNHAAAVHARLRLGLNNAAKLESTMEPTQIPPRICSFCIRWRLVCIPSTMLLVPALLWCQPCELDPAGHSAKCGSRRRSKQNKKVRRKMPTAT